MWRETNKVVAALAVTKRVNRQCEPSPNGSIGEIGPSPNGFSKGPPSTNGLIRKASR